MSALGAFRGQEDGDLDALDLLIGHAVSQPTDADIDRALFGIFERFPQEDGHGVYWSIVHGLEARGDYESGLVASVRRSPSPFALLMLNRLCNGGRTECAGVAIRSLLEGVAASSDVTPEVRQEAAEFLAYQRDRAAE